jgi:hypothetical protein
MDTHVPFNLDCELSFICHFVQTDVCERRADVVRAALTGSIRPKDSAVSLKQEPEGARHINEICYYFSAFERYKAERVVSVLVTKTAVGTQTLRLCHKGITRRQSLRNYPTFFLKIVGSGLVV